MSYNIVVMYYIIQNFDGEKVTTNEAYSISLVNSHGYYKFQVEIGATTNRDFNIEIAHKS